MCSSTIRYPMKLSQQKCLCWLFKTVIILAWSLNVVSAKVDVSSQDGTEGVLSFGMDINSEEDHSHHMLDSLKCDACQLLALKLREKFEAIHRKRPSLKHMPESELLDATDEVCNDKFEEYGIKEVNKVKRLSGPGMDTDEFAGVTQRGGLWPHRIMQMCANYMGVLGEEIIYRVYLENGKLENYLCRGSGIRGECKESDGRSNSENQSNRKDEF